MPANKVREEIAKRFLEALEQERLPWRAGWQTLKPRNGVSGIQYRGINRLVLSMIADEKGYEDPRWCTFKQASDQGWMVKKGEKASYVEYWYQYDTRQKKSLTWNEVAQLLRKDPAYEQNLVLRCRVSAVFNGEQIDGIPALETTQISIGELRAKRDTLIRNMGVGYREQGTEAYYTPSQDRITLPPEKLFYDQYAYMATLLHEAGHATGHESRLGRNLTGGFGSEGYAREELRAEIASAFVTQELQIDMTADAAEQHMKTHAAYIQSWAEVIRKDSNELFRAINDAQGIADYLIEKGEFIQAAETPEQRAVEIPHALEELPEGGLKLTLTGDGKVPDLDSGRKAPWHDQAARIREVEIGETVTSLGTGTFSGMEHLRRIDVKGRLGDGEVDSGIGDCKELREIHYAANDNALRVLAVEPGRSPYLKSIPNTLKALQAEVGGYIEAVYPYADPVAIICNEEGKLEGLPLNRAVRDEETGEIVDIIAGKFLIAGLGEEDFGSLTPDMAEKYADRFEKPEIFLRLNGQIVAVPVEPERNYARLPEQGDPRREALGEILRNHPGMTAEEMSGVKAALERGADPDALRRAMADTAPEKPVEAREAAMLRTMRMGD